MQHSLDLVELDVLRLNAIDEFLFTLRSLYREAVLDAFDMPATCPPVYWRATSAAIEFSSAPLDGGSLLGFPATAISSLESTAPIDFWPRVRRALLGSIFDQEPPGELVQFPDAWRAELLAELVERVNLVHTVPDPRPDVIRLEFYAPGGLTTDDTMQADMLRVVPASQEVAGLLPTILKLSGIDPSSALRAPGHVLVFRLA